MNMKQRSAGCLERPRLRSSQLAALGSQALAGSEDDNGIGEGARSADGAAAARPPDRGERDPGRSRARRRCGCRSTRARRTARRSGTCSSTPPTPGIAHDLGVNYAPKLSNIAHRLTRSAVQTVTLDSPTPDAEQVRAGRRRLPGRAGLQPDPDRRAGPERLPAGRSSSPARSPAPGYSPFIRIDGLADRVQRADRRHRRRPVRRRAPHEHRRPCARHPHRRAVGSGPVRGVVGGPAVRQGLRRRRADRLHLAPTPVSR